jgi:molybdenum cofactor cytidylyltransferase
MLRAIVLAAGASSRMGRPKAGLLLNSYGDTFLSRSLRALIVAGVPDIVVVTGAAPEAVRSAARRVRKRVRFVQNDAWQDGQLTSLVKGLAPRAGQPVEGALVTLVDAPLASSETIRTVINVWRRTRAPIVRPARGDEHGHPVIFDAVLFDELRAADPRVGAKSVVRSREREIVNVPVEDPGAFVDIDTEDEYRRVLRDAKPGA